MPFLHPKDMQVLQMYKLTEVVEGQEVSSGIYFLVLVEESDRKEFPLLGFSKSIQKNQKAEIWLSVAWAQFGDPTWRRTFKCNSQLEVYWPAGGRTWNWSYVEVEAIINPY